MPYQENRAELYCFQTLLHSLSVCSLQVNKSWGLIRSTHTQQSSMRRPLCVWKKPFHLTKLNSRFLGCYKESFFVPFTEQPSSSLSRRSITGCQQVKSLWGAEEQSCTINFSISFNINHYISPLINTNININ